MGRLKRPRTTVIERAQVLLTLMFNINVNIIVRDSKFDAMSETREDNAYKSDDYTYRNRDFEDKSYRNADRRFRTLSMSAFSKSVEQMLHRNRCDNYEQI